MLFSTRQLQKKCLKQNMPLSQVFPDLNKAFDTVKHDALWKLLTKLGCPLNFITMFKELHSNMKTCVMVDGELSNEIAIDNGVKQEDIPAANLFIYFAVALSYCMLMTLTLLHIPRGIYTY